MTPIKKAFSQKIITPKIIWLSGYKEILTSKKRFKLFFGGRGSGKSFQLCNYFLYRLSHFRENILVLRKTAKANDLSTFYEFQEHLKLYKISNYFKIFKDPPALFCPQTGGRLFFSGLFHPERIKSVSSIDHVWIEEADELSFDDFIILERSLRKNENVSLCISFNPPKQGKEHWLYQIFFKNPHPQAAILHSSYKDNPFLPKSYKEGFDTFYKNDPYAYKREVLGEWVVDKESRVYPHFEVLDEEKDKKKLAFLRKKTALYGLDFGYNDASALIEVFFDEKTDEILISREAYKNKISPSILGNFLKTLEPFAKNYEIIADSSRPELIFDLKKEGFSISPCHKKKDSITRGIDFIRKRKLFISSSCAFTQKELALYSFVKNKDGSYDTSRAMDGFNHALDALRYALEAFIFALPPARFYKI